MFTRMLPKSIMILFISFKIHIFTNNPTASKSLCFTRSDANKVFNGVLDGVRCRQTEEMYAKDWTQASPSAADQPLTAAGAGAECSASASGES